ncbi:MAG: heme-binding protein [Alphaproteobacteria bacterium]|nr:heme-binding protein [Alphaproteobacteria bacterium]
MTVKICKRFMLQLLILIMLGGNLIGNAMAVEQISYQTVSRDGDVEIRDYQALVQVQITKTGSRYQAPSDAFRDLFGYIGGDNQAGQKIEMTAPVSQQAVAGNAETDEWKVSFYMPEKFSLADLPNPENADLKLIETAPRRVAVLEFYGRRSGENMDINTEKLRAYLRDNNIAFIDNPFYAFYNSPMMIWFLRRNEVMFELE